MLSYIHHLRIIVYSISHLLYDTKGQDILFSYLYEKTDFQARKNMRICPSGRPSNVLEACEGTLCITIRGIVM